MTVFNRMPLHEKRAGWIALISASFERITIFGYARHRGLESLDLISSLENEIADMEKRLRGFVPTKHLLAFWKSIVEILQALADGYYDTLTKLADFKWSWWECGDEGEILSIQLEKQSIIKRLAVYDWVISILRIAVTSSFEDSRPWFLSGPPMPQSEAVVQRRLSCPETRARAPLRNSERMTVEIGILRWTQLLEEELRVTMGELQREYNQAGVFEHYIYNLQWTMEQEKEVWEQDKRKEGKEDGETWPYPDDSLKPQGLDMPGSKQQQRHSPVGEVLAWTDDEELRTLFLL